MRDSEAPERLVTRRHALQALIVGGGAAVVSVAFPSERAAAQNDKTSPRATAPIIRAILRDVNPSALRGSILFHEHLSGTTRFSDDVALMVEEARGAMRDDGIACVVDGGHPDFKFTPGGYRLDSLTRISSESGLPVVASGGYYNQASYPEGLAARSADDIAQELARDAAQRRLGAFGEIGQRGGVLTETERKVFEAVAKAQVLTGLPIFTHNAYMGKRPNADSIPMDAALRQLDVLESAGATPNRIAIGHVCCLDDPKVEVAKKLAGRGAYVGFDRATLETISLPDTDRVIMAMEFIHAGFADRLLLSSDFFDERSLKKNGGPGIGQAATVFGPKLLEAGLPEATLRMILEENPKRFLAFVPRG